MKRLALMMAVATLAGCDRLPAPPATTASSAAASSAVSAYPSPLWADEAKLLATVPGEVERKDFVLTITNGGKAVATLTDTDGDGWIFAGAFTATDAGKPRRYYIFRLIEENDSPHYSLIVDDSGQPVAWVPETTVVYDGPLIAAGNAGIGDDGDFEIDDWSVSPHKTYAFSHAGNCLPEKWISAGEVAVGCSDAVKDYDVSVRKVSANAWAWPRGEKAVGKTSAPIDASGLTYAGAHGFRTVTP